MQNVQNSRFPRSVAAAGVLECRDYREQCRGLALTLRFMKQPRNEVNSDADGQRRGSSYNIVGGGKFI
jgi:hypothetical protein